MAMTPYTPADHGINGLLPVTLSGCSQLFDSRVIATAKDFSEEFLLKEDMEAQDLLDVGHVQASIADRQCSGSANTYLAAAINRPNIYVLLNAHVAKLLYTGTIEVVPSFRPVEFGSKPGGELRDSHMVRGNFHRLR